MRGDGITRLKKKQCKEREARFVMRRDCAGISSEHAKNGSTCTVAKNIPSTSVLAFPAASQSFKSDLPSVYFVCQRFEVSTVRA